MLQLLGLLGFVCLFGGCCAYFLLFLRRNHFSDKLAYARAWTLSTILDARLSETSRPICLFKAYQNVLLPFWAARDAYILIRLLGSGQLPEYGILWIASCICTISAYLFLRFFDPLALIINIAALLLGSVCLFLPTPLLVIKRPPVPAAICGAVAAILFIGYCLRRRDLFIDSDSSAREDDPYDDETLFGVDEELDDDAFFGPVQPEPDRTAIFAAKDDEAPEWGLGQPPMNRAAKRATIKKRSSAAHIKRHTKQIRTVSCGHKREDGHEK